VAASLAASGLGVTFLPVRCYEKEIADGKLMVVRTTPALPPVEFTATSQNDSLDSFVRRLARLAAEISDFQRAPRKGSAGLGQRP
jgi:DNA-binding transcriptional LysR family regulator